jgi:hypothetical protein
MYIYSYKTNCLRIVNSLIKINLHDLDLIEIKIIMPSHHHSDIQSPNLRTHILRVTPGSIPPSITDGGV